MKDHRPEELCERAQALKTPETIRKASTSPIIRMMKLLPAFLNFIALVIILAYLTLELIYVPSKHFSPITIKTLAVLAIPFALTLIGLRKRGSRTLRIVGIAANAIFVAPLAMLVAAASLNIGGTAPLAVFLLPPTLITILNIFVLIKTFKGYRAIEPQENQISNPKA